MFSIRRDSINDILKKNDYLLTGNIANFGGVKDNFKNPSLTLKRNKNIFINNDISTSPDVLCDLEHIPVKDEYFDSFLFLETLEHVKNPYKVLHEINRTLKKGAKGIISMPFIYQYHKSPNDFSRWTYEKLELEIKKSNFEIIKVYYNANLFGVIFDLTRSYLLNFYSKNIFYKILYNVFKPFKIIFVFLDKIIPKYNAITGGHIIIVKKKING